MIGTVGAQLVAAEVAILDRTIAHPERRGALYTELARTDTTTVVRVVREVHRSDLPWLERATIRAQIHEARMAVIAGDPVLAAAYRRAVLARWSR